VAACAFALYFVPLRHTSLITQPKNTIHSLHLI